MAHIRKNCRNLSTTVSFEPTLLEQVEDYRFANRKQNRSDAIADLLAIALQQVNKERERMLG